jgi:hypothetical protein
MTILRPNISPTLSRFRKRQATSTRLLGLLHLERVKDRIGFVDLYACRQRTDIYKSFSNRFFMLIEWCGMRRWSESAEQVLERERSCRRLIACVRVWGRMGRVCAFEKLGDNNLPAKGKRVLAATGSCWQGEESVSCGCIVVIAYGGELTSLQFRDPPF